MQMILEGVSVDDAATALDVLRQSNDRLHNLIHHPSHRDALNADAMGTDPPEGATGGEEMPEWRRQYSAVHRFIAAFSV